MEITPEPDSTTCTLEQPSSMFVEPGSNQDEIPVGQISQLASLTDMTSSPVDKLDKTNESLGPIEAIPSSGDKPVESPGSPNKTRNGLALDENNKSKDIKGESELSDSKAGQDSSVANEESLVTPECVGESLRLE